MADFALVLYSKKKEDNTWNGIVKSILGWYKEIFMKESPAGNVEKIELYNNTSLYLIYLPYDLDTLKGMSKAKLKSINDFIFRTCRENNIYSCIVCDKLLEIGGIGSSKPDKFTGRCLYESLLLNIMDEIYSSRGIRVDCLDISVIEGESFETLYSIVKILSPHVKFMTVVSENKSRAERLLNEIYEETGLAMMITSDRYSGVKNSDLIINLGVLNEEDQKIKLKPKAILLNYSEHGVSKLKGENFIINSIEVKLPLKLMQKLDKRIFEYVPVLTVAEALVLHKLDIGKSPAGTPADLKTREAISAEFGKCGFKITGFCGRHSLIKVESIQNAI